MNSTRKVQFDDVFDIFSMLIGSNYVTAYDTKLQLTRFSPAIVEMLDLPGEYVEDGAYNWLDHVHPEDRILYDNTMKEVLDEIRKNPFTSRVPIIFLTGKNDKDVVMRIPERKPDGYLLKSTGKEEMLDTLDRFFAENILRGK